MIKVIYFEISAYFVAFLFNIYFLLFFKKIFVTARVCFKNHQRIVLSGR